MKKAKYLLLALMMTGLSQVWASEPDGPGKSTAYAVQWSGTTDVTYNAMPQNGIGATYTDGNGVTHNCVLTFHNGAETFSTPRFPVNAGAWTVVATSPLAGVTLTGDTALFHIQPAPVYVTGAAAEIAKFADGSLRGVVTDNGTLNDVQGSDPLGHLTTAIFSDANVGTGKTITLYYALTGDPALLANYAVIPSSRLYTNSGIVIPDMVPDLNRTGDSVTRVQNGFDLYAYGYCQGGSYGVKYHLVSGNPDEYSVDFADPSYTDIPWRALTTGGTDGELTLDLPAAMGPGNHTLTVYFRDSRFPALVSKPFTVTVSVSLPETYTMPLFDNVIALVDTCGCFSDIQWYHRADATKAWAKIPGATDYYYRQEGGLTGEYFVSARMNGAPVYTCPQTDVETLVTDDSKAASVKAYPNPAAGRVNISVENSRVVMHSLRVVNTVGMEVLSRSFTGNDISIDLGNLPRGTYSVTVDGTAVRVIKN